MNKKQKPFWEETYQNKDVITFSVQPNPTVKEFEYLMSKESNILEVGCGEGQNAIYLAQQGYSNVDAFDLSENGIDKLKSRCEILDIQLNAFVDDLISYQYEKNTT